MSATLKNHSFRFVNNNAKEPYAVVIFTRPRAASIMRHPEDRGKHSAVGMTITMLYTEEKHTRWAHKPVDPNPDFEMLYSVELFDKYIGGFGIYLSKKTVDAYLAIRESIWAAEVARQNGGVIRK